MADSNQTFSGFTFEELCGFIQKLDAISHPTNQNEYTHAADIILDNLPASLKDDERDQIMMQVEKAREQMETKIANFDSLITPEKIANKIRVKTGKNAKTRGIAGTFREGIGEVAGARIQITFGPGEIETQELIETLIHEYVHASSFLRGEDNHDNSYQFGQRCLNAFSEWNQRLAEITGLDQDDPRLKELTADVFGHGQVYEGVIGKISGQVIEYRDHEKMKLQNEQFLKEPWVVERQKAFPKGVPTLHKGMVAGSYRSNDERYVCEKEDGEWVLVDKENPGMETYFATLSEAKSYVQEEYMNEWRQSQKPELEGETVMADTQKPDLDQSDMSSEMDLSTPTSPARLGH